MQVAVPLNISSPKTRALLLALPAVVLSIAVLVWGDEFARLGRLGYLGVFVVTLLASGALILPVPYLVVVFAAARTLDPLTVAVVAGFAAALGELTGYAVGASGRILLHKHTWVQRFGKLRGVRAFLLIVVASFVPNPFFDAVGIASGAVGIPASTFVQATFIGKSLRFLIIAVVGHTFFPIPLAAEP